MYTLPVYSVKLLECQNPRCVQFFPCEVFVCVVPNATSRIRRHFLVSCPHADCLQGECLLPGKVIRVQAEEYSFGAKVGHHTVQLRLPQEGVQVLFVVLVCAAVQEKSVKCHGQAVDHDIL